MVDPKLGTGEVEGGEKVTEVCRRLGVSEQTFYRWKNQYSGLSIASPSSTTRWTNA